MISIIIPSYKDPLLQKTVNSLLENAEGKIEIIIVLDGYWPADYDWSDKRIKVVHLGRNRGMREAINAGVAVAKGEYIMRTDEHCIFAKGYDVELTKRFKDNWIMYPMRYYLDTEKWEVMGKEPNVYNKLVIDERPKFSGVNWASRAIERKDKMIDDSMAMQGSCWIMKKSWWDKVIGKLQTEGYGPLYQDSHEMVFKTWKAGGRLVVNKNTWYAHKHRDFNRTHNNGTRENPSNNESCFKYSLDTWREYYENVIKPQWEI